MPGVLRGQETTPGCKKEEKKKSSEGVHMAGLDGSLRSTRGFEF